MNFGEIVKNKAESLNFAVKELAELTGRNPHTVYADFSEAIGIVHHKALEAIKNHKILSPLYTIRCIVAGDNKEREMGCIPLSYLNGWLFMVDVNRVGEQARVVLLAYQEKCFTVLHEHFFGAMEIQNEAKQVFCTLHEKNVALRDALASQKETEAGQQIANLRKDIRALENRKRELEMQTYGKQLQIL